MQVSEKREGRAERERARPGKSSRHRYRDRDKEVPCGPELDTFVAKWIYVHLLLPSFVLPSNPDKVFGCPKLTSG
jgi:hypothetical protein